MAIYDIITLIQAQKKDIRNIMVRIERVDRGSYAEKAGIKPGDKLISINGKDIKDVLDYRYYICEKNLVISVSRDSQTMEFKIRKRDEYDDIGLEFETFLMDKKRTCANKCIFCFIDQNPKGMRETIYFKDDDTRLSFLQGNYVILTNLTDKDIQRIIDMRMTPVNISVHTTNPDLRVRMLNNKNAGTSLRFLKTLDEGGIRMNCQIVLCKGINDGIELERTIVDLSGYKNIESIAIVPAGLTGHRENLCHLEPFDKKEAGDVIDLVECYSQMFRKERGIGLAYCSDEFYITAERPMPSESQYDGYPQIENGVGMITSFTNEFEEELEFIDEVDDSREVSIATGYAAYDCIKKLCEETEKKFSNVKVHVYRIKNNFFGGHVTVAGLVTGKDLTEQLKGQPLGEELLIPSVMLRHEGDLFLCGMSLTEAEDILGIKIKTNGPNGADLLHAIIGM